MSRIEKLRTHVQWAGFCNPESVSRVREVLPHIPAILTLLGIRIQSIGQGQWIQDPRAHLLILLAIRRCPTEKSQG